MSDDFKAAFAKQQAESENVQLRNRCTEQANLIEQIWLTCQEDDIDQVKALLAPYFGED